MSARPQTIQIYLPGGDPRGIRQAELTTRIPQVIEVPRALLSDFLKMPESKQVAVYFLVGQSTDAEDPLVYIGQTSDMPMRFPRHNQEKDYWDRALVLISKTNNLTQTHALFLEWYCLQEAKRAAAEAVVARLAAAGAVDDAAFAAARARRLARAGRSAPAIAAHLAAKGAGAAADEAIGSALPDPDAQLAAALIAARKRRIGPFGPPDAPPEARQKALAALARAGFSRAVAEAALALDADEAEARIAVFRRG